MAANNFPPRSNRVIRDIRRMLDPSQGGVTNPYLHRVLQERLPDMEVPLSRCVHLFEIEGDMEYRDKTNPGLRVAQSHDWLFQVNYRPDEDGWQWIGRPDEVIGHAREGDNVCPLLLERLHFYGKIGSGTFGVVHAARDKRDTHGHGKRHYAVKLTTHHTLLSAARKHGNSEMGKWIDGPNEQIHYIPGEAIWMLFLRNSERFPAIDSVYTHGQIQAIVMSAAIDYNPDREVRPSLMRPKQSEYPATTGKDLVEGKQTHLSERDVQKIASQIVEAFVYLLDMDLGHDDFGLQNFAVSEKLDVTLLDFGQMYFAESEGGFKQEEYLWVPFQEYLLQPEFAIEFEKSLFDVDFTSEFPVIKDTWRIHRAHDVRAQYLWSIATVVFELLHGHSPWEEPEWDPDIDTIRYWYRYDEGDFERKVQKMKERRMRLINEELPINEEVSQDAADFFRAMFQKDVSKRSTFPDLISFPWLQGEWVDYEGDEGFQRPNPSSSL